MLSPVYLRSPDRLWRLLIAGIAVLIALALVTPVLAQTPPPKPGAPSGLKVALTDTDPPVTTEQSDTGTMVSVTWDKPGQQAGIADGDLRYELWYWDYTPPAGWNKSTGEPPGELTDRTASLDGLRPGMVHQIQVRAYQEGADEDARGPWATTSATPYQVLTVPLMPMSAPGNEQLTISWEAPNGKTGEVTYQVEWTTRPVALAPNDGTEGWSSVGAGDAKEDSDMAGSFMATITGLENGEEVLSCPCDRH